MRRSLLVLVLIAVAVVSLLFWLTGRPASEREQARPAGQPTNAPASVASQPTPRPTPASRDVVTEVTEAELQTQLTRMLVGKSLGSTPLGDATVQSVAVTLRNRQVRVAGDAKAGFLNAPFTAAGTVVPDPAGRPRVQIEEATVGGVGLPEGTRAALADMLQTQVDGMFADPSMKVHSIDIADGKMRLVQKPS